MLEGGLKGASSWLEGGFKVLIEGGFKGGLKGASRGLEGGLKPSAPAPKGASRMLEGGFKGA